MSLTLYFHPLSSFCMKTLVALYETATPFEPRIIDLSNAAQRAELVALWPLARFPVLRDAAAGRTVPETTAIIEYLAQHAPRGPALIPADPDLAREVRLRDRVFDLHINTPMAKIVTDKLRPAGRNDPHGVDEARVQLETAYGIIDGLVGAGPYAVGDSFTMADCAAAPALFYANQVVPLGDRHRTTTAYLARLLERPSFARVLAEAEPYFKMFPG